jgi:TRAP-type C4-dicarboxylate transport system permease small subunit
VTHWWRRLAIWSPNTPKEADAPPAAPPQRSRFGRALYRLAEGAAVLGGLLLAAVAGVTVYSIIGRQAASLGWPSGPGAVPGAFELVELGVAVAVFLFLPYCQMNRGHIAADLFTAAVGPRLKAGLTAFGDLVFTAIAGLLAWRLALGALSMQTAGQTTMVLRVPVWWAYLPAVAALVLLTVVCAYTAWSGLRAALGRRGRLPAAERTLAEGPY